MNTPSNNKYIYIKLCEEKDNIPLFMQAWWMDAACYGKEWDVLLAEKEGKIVGVMPFHRLKRFGCKLIVQPPFTQYNGVWIDYPELSTEQEKYAFEKEIMMELISKLDQLKLNYYEQNFHFSVTNWQPFYWKSFSQTTRYTYLIEDISDLHVVFDSFDYAKQKHIKKSQLLIDIDFTLSPNAFYDFHKQTLEQRGQQITYTRELFEQIHQAATSRQQGIIISAKDKNGNLHAALFVVWDKNSAYNLISAIDVDFKASGASTLVVWEIIRFLSDKTKSFDFEGSMIESVAKSFQQFGTVRIPYFTISKSYSKLVSWLIKIQKNGIS